MLSSTNTFVLEGLNILTFEKVYAQNLVLTAKFHVLPICNVFAEFLLSFRDIGT